MTVDSSSAPMPMVLGDLIATVAARDPNRAAIVDAEQTLSYARLVDHVGMLALRLANAGVGRGDAVAIVMGNQVEWVSAFFAVAELGATAVPLSPQLKPPELGFYGREASVRLVVGTTLTADACRALADALGSVDIIVVDDGEAQVGRAPMVTERSVARPEDPAVVLFSSGATGRPKRVSRTHRDLLSEAASVTVGLGVTAADRVLCTIPFFHTYGLGCCLLTTYAAGATLVLPAQAQPLVLQRGRLVAQIRDQRVTILPSVPYVLRLLAEQSHGADLGSLRLCFSAATRLPRSVFTAFDAAFGVAVRQLYGTTETGAVSANVDDDPRAAPDSVGGALPGVEVRVVDDAGVAVIDGRIGNLLLRAPGMARGYEGLEESSLAAFDDGAFRSGDRGRIDESGRIFLTGRTKRLIDVLGGDKVDPIEVEDVLAVHPHVRDVVVVGVPSATDGEELVKAVVVSDDRDRERELIRYCRERLAEYKVPRQVSFVAEIARDADGSVLFKYLVD